VAWDATFRPNADPTSGCNTPRSTSTTRGTTRGAPAAPSRLPDQHFGEKGPEQWSEQEQAIGRGFAKLPLDNIGVQYGLDAFNARQITAEQFADLNEEIGAYDQDFERTRGRLEADPGSVGILYRTGRSTDGAPWTRGRSSTCVARATTSSTPITTATRCGSVSSGPTAHANNHVQWLSHVALVGEPSWPVQSLELMDRWLAAVEADDSDDPREVKVARHRPTDASTRAGSPESRSPTGRRAARRSPTSVHRARLPVGPPPMTS
jgi:hypothetical protein